MRLFFPSGESWLFLMKGNMWSLRSPNHQRLSWNSSLQVMINTDSSLPQRRNNCHANENLWPKTVRRRHWNSYRVACTIFPYIRQLPDVCISIFIFLLVFSFCYAVPSFPFRTTMRWFVNKWRCNQIKVKCESCPVSNNQTATDIQTFNLDYRYWICHQKWNVRASLQSTLWLS